MLIINIIKIACLGQGKHIQTFAINLKSIYIY